MNNFNQNPVNRIKFLMGEMNSNSNKETDKNIIDILKTSNGEEYGIVYEGNKYHVKKIINLGGTKSHTFIDTLHSHSKNYIFENKNSASKKLNVLIKSLNDVINEEEQYVLSLDSDSNSNQNSVDTDIDSDVDFDIEDTEDNFDFEDSDVDTDLDTDLDTQNNDSNEVDPKKSIQKLTGKLGEEIRTYENEDSSDLNKYVINSIVAAIDWGSITAEDFEDILDKIETKYEENSSSDEGETIQDITGDNDSLDLDLENNEEDIDLDLDLNLESLSKNDLRQIQKLFTNK